MLSPSRTALMFFRGGGAHPLLPLFPRCGRYHAWLLIFFIRNALGHKGS